MNKTVIRYFIDFTEKQEKWLNEMAARGFRLTGCGKLTYKFEQCAPGEYRYCVEFAGEKSCAKHKDYRRFLEGLGYRVIPKNINLNWSFGKARLRLWAEGAGKAAASPGAYNNELLIVEKRDDGKPFALHTGTEDLAVRFKILRNAYIWVAVPALTGAAFFTAAMLAGFDLAGAGLPAWCGAVMFGLIGAVGVLFSAKYARIAKRYSGLAEISE